MTTDTEMSLWFERSANPPPGASSDPSLTDGAHSGVDSNSGPSGLGFGLVRFLAAIRLIRCCTRWAARSTGNISFLVRRARMHTGPVALCNIREASRKRGVGLLLSVFGGSCYEESSSCEIVGVGEAVSDAA